MKRAPEDSYEQAHDQPPIDTTLASGRIPWGAVLVAIVLLVLAGAWIESGPGLTKRPSRPAFITRERTDDADQRAITVRVASSRARDYQASVRLQGITAAARKVTLRSEINGRVVELPVAKGDLVRQGEVVARISVDNHEARLREVEAQLKHRVLEYEATARLHAQGYRAQTNLAAARANLEASRADRERARKAIADGQILAPFAGVLNQRDVEVGDYVTVGAPIALVLDLETIIAHGRVPERERAMIALQHSASARFLDATSAHGKVRYISATADAQTRTYLVEVELPNPQRSIVDGQSVQLDIPATVVAAHQIPASVLTVDDDGQLGLKLIADDARVIFQPVTALSQSPSGVWVKNLPAQCTIIVVGQEFVAVGDVVDTVDVGPLRALLY